MEKKEMKDGCIVTVCGKKKRFEIITVKVKEIITRKGIFTVCVERPTKTGNIKEKFQFDIWDETEFERVEKIPMDSMVRVTARPSNYNFTRDGKDKFSYDLTLINIFPYSGHSYSEFAIRGTLFKDVELGTMPGKPYMILRMVVNDGKKPVFIHVRHYGFASGFVNIGKKDNNISCEGYFKRNLEDGSFQFFATHVWSNSKEDSFVAIPQLED